VWKKYDGGISPLNDGIVIMDNFSFSFIGRLLLFDEYYHPGLIVLNKGIKFLYAANETFKDFSTHHVEYLVKNENYKWSQSSNGSLVSNAVQVQPEFQQHIGKITIDGVTHVGSIYLATDGLYYSDWSATVSLENSYEVLTCGKASELFFKK
jgi:hypothetical protein